MKTNRTLAAAILGLSISSSALANTGSAIRVVDYDKENPTGSAIWMAPQVDEEYSKPKLALEATVWQGEDQLRFTIDWGRNPLPSSSLHQELGHISITPLDNRSFDIYCSENEDSSAMVSPIPEFGEIASCSFLPKLDSEFFYLDSQVIEDEIIPNFSTYFAVEAIAYLAKPLSYTNMDVKEYVAFDLDMKKVSQNLRSSASALGMNKNSFSDQEAELILQNVMDLDPCNILADKLVTGGFWTKITGQASDLWSWLTGYRRNGDVKNSTIDAKKIAYVHPDKAGCQQFRDLKSDDLNAFKITYSEFRGKLAEKVSKGLEENQEGRFIIPVYQEKEVIKVFLRSKTWPSLEEMDADSSPFPYTPELLLKK